MDLDLIKRLLLIATASSVVATAFIQKIKEGCACSICFKKRSLMVLSFIVSIVIGAIFSLTFSDVSRIEALWVGFFTYVGASGLYQSLENKVFKSFDTLKVKEESKEEITLITYQR